MIDKMSDETLHWRAANTVIVLTVDVVRRNIF